MNFGNSPHARSRTRDTQVLIAANYADGRAAYFRVKPRDADEGSALLRRLAAAAQETGEIPAGEVVSVKRVR